MTRPIPLPEPYRFADATELIRGAARGGSLHQALHLATERLGHPGVIGMVAIDDRNWTSQRAHLGYWLGRAHWRNGYGSEVAGHVYELTFDALGLHRIETKVLAKNRRSRQVLRRLRFAVERVYRQRVRTEGRWNDQLGYALLRRE